MESRDEIACPACGEMILSSAKKCKHCGEWVSGTSPAAPAVAATDEDRKRENEFRAILVVFLVVAGILMFLLETEDTPTYSVNTPSRRAFTREDGARTVIMQSLKNQSSYQQYSYSELWQGKDSQGRPAFIAMVNFSATNSFGGRLDYCRLVAWSQVGDSVYSGPQATTSCIGPGDAQSEMGQVPLMLEWNRFPSGNNQ